MTQMSYQQAVKLVRLQQQEIQRLGALVASKDAALHALGRETRGSILLNWHLVNEQGGEVRVPAKTLVEISPDAKFGYRFDPETDAYVFTARIEKTDLAAIIPPEVAAEPVVDAVYDGPAPTEEIPADATVVRTPADPYAEAAANPAFVKDMDAVTEAFSITDNDGLEEEDA